MDDTAHQLHILRRQISALQQKEKDLIQEDDRRFLEKAKANIGRCFYDSDSETYAKVIAAPRPYTTRTGPHLNRYQYPAIFIGKSDESIVPVYEDELFSGAWGEVADPSCRYEEITQQEFDAAFTKAMENFMRNILSIGADSPKAQ